MKVLVTAASKHGSTHEIALAIGRELREAGCDAEVLPVTEVTSLAGYGAVVLGSAAYYGKWLDEAVELAEAHADALRALPLWLFSSGPLGWPLKPPADEAVHVDELIERLAPIEHRLLAGELDRHRLGLVERSVVRAVHAPEGDFRDWDGIEAWAREIAAALRVRAPGQPPGAPPGQAPG